MFYVSSLSFMNQTTLDTLLVVFLCLNLVVKEEKLLLITLQQ